MEMIPHKTVTLDFDRLAMMVDIKKTQVRGPIFVVEEDILPTVTLLGDVMRHTRADDSA